MSYQYHIPGAGHISDSGAANRSLPGGIFITTVSTNVDGFYQQQQLGNITLTHHPVALVLESVDGDNGIRDGQTGVVILPQSPSRFAASGNRVKIVQGGVTKLQTITAESETSITITTDLTGMTIPSTATLYVGKPPV